MLKEERKIKDKAKFEYQLSRLETINTQIGRVRFNRNLAVICAAGTLVTAIYSVCHTPSFMTGALFGAGCFSSGIATAFHMHISDLKTEQSDIEHDETYIQESKNR